MVTSVDINFCFSTDINITLMGRRGGNVHAYCLFNTFVHCACPFLFAIQQAKTQLSEYAIKSNIPTSTYATPVALIKHVRGNISWGSLSNTVLRIKLLRYRSPQIELFSYVFG
jgi:hypothetical protein